MRMEKPTEEHQDFRKNNELEKYSELNEFITESLQRGNLTKAKANFLNYTSFFNTDASESVAYNNPLFPVYARYGVLSWYQNYSVISHWHEDLELIYIKTGQMTYNVNGQLVDLPEGSGILVNSRQFHYGFSAEHQECEFICLLFSPKIFCQNTWFYETFIERITENTAIPYLYLSQADWTSGILQSIDKIYRCFAPGDSKPPENPSDYFELITQVTAIMRLLYEHLPAADDTQRRTDTDLAALKQMTAFIEAHFRDHITLSDIASAGTCCKSKCSALFRTYLQDTPITYLTKLRLRESQRALLGDYDNITDIALAYGFNSASYYCEIFKKYYGMSPVQFKNKTSQNHPNQ